MGLSPTTSRCSSSSRTTASKAKCKPEQWKAALSLNRAGVAPRPASRIHEGGVLRSDCEPDQGREPCGPNRRRPARTANSPMPSCVLLGGEQVFHRPHDDQQRVAADLAAITAEGLPCRAEEELGIAGCAGLCWRESQARRCAEKPSHRLPGEREGGGRRAEAGDRGVFAYTNFGEPGKDRETRGREGPRDH